MRFTMQPKTWLSTMALGLGLGLTLAATLGAGGDEAGPAATPAKVPEYDDAAMAKGRTIFPKHDAWNQDISKELVDPNSDRLIAGIGMNKPLHPDFGTQYGIPYMYVNKATPRTAVTFDYADESDKGPYPIPANPLIEGFMDPRTSNTGDRHCLMIDTDAWVLYETWATEKTADGWKAGSGAVFDLKADPHRPAGFTSADAAGLPVWPGLVKYSEVHGKTVVPHAFRFTIVHSRHGYIAPATHYASNKTDPNLPPMGMRVRLKADFDISKFEPDEKTILQTLKTYGMILADNGSDWFLSGAPDNRWDDDELHALTHVKGKDFEVLKMGEVTTR